MPLFGLRDAAGAGDAARDEQRHERELDQVVAEVRLCLVRDERRDIEQRDTSPQEQQQPEPGVSEKEAQHYE